MSETVITSNLTYGDITIDFSALPPSSQFALARRGLAHYLGNEQASKVTSWKDARNADCNPPNDAEIATYKGDLITAALAALAEGKVGANVRGPRGMAAETVMRELAQKEVMGILAQVGLSLPAKKDAVVTFPNGDTFTRVQLIERRIERHKERLMKAAETELRARERLASKAAEGAKAKGAAGIDMLD